MIHQAWDSGFILATAALVVTGLMAVLWMIRRKL